MAKNSRAVVGKRRRPRKTRLFVEPMNAATNAFIARSEPTQPYIEEQDASEIRCEDGEKRGMWEIRHQAGINRLKESAESMTGIHFTVWKKIGESRAVKVEEIKSNVPGNLYEWAQLEQKS